MKNLSKNCVLVVSPVLLLGGTEIQTLSMVRVLISAGYKVAVCCYYEFEDSIAIQFKDAGANVILLHLDRSVGRSGFCKMLELIQKLVAIFQETRPDIVHVQYLAPGLIPIIVARLSRIRTVFATVHQPGHPYGMKAKLLIRLGAYLSTAFFCVSKSAEESWFGNSEVYNTQYVNRKRKHYTICNAVDSSIINQAVSSIDCNSIKKALGLNGNPVIGVVGRLRSEKGHLILLDAMAEVTKVIPEVKLLVVGDGPDRAKLNERAKKLGIVDHILWLGAKEQSEVFDLYSVMDVVVVPSLFEGFGLTAAEAMAAGKPVVASAVDGLNEIIEDNVTGYLFPVGDNISLARNIIRLLYNSEKSKVMGGKGRKRISDLFSFETSSKSWLAAYKEFSK
ncbi:hypothetical protein C6A37_05825 [Desulfobacteraceae bacterium SEEP-SAG9]|nr:hypothetical protein C6A37_05825 [Desulfobacteraceae bacterium SEEP-SAG9]